MSSQAVLGIWLFIHAPIKVSKRGPTGFHDGRVYPKEYAYFVRFVVFSPRGLVVADFTHIPQVYFTGSRSHTTALEPAKQY